MEPLFSLQNIHFSYEDAWLLRDVSLALHPGERVGITGDNGCGKSTLLHIGAGLLPPPRGRVLFQGRACVSPADFARLRRSLGYLLQNAEDMLFCPTVLEDLAFGPVNYGASDAEAGERARALLEQLGLSRLAARNAHNLSGGEQKLAALAAILAPEPDFLFLDEPTNELDKHARALLITILEQTALPAIIVSHDRAFLETVCNRLFQMENGTLTAIEPNTPSRQKTP